MFTRFIGKKSNKIKNAIERGMVERFAIAIGDPHPIYIDEQFGLESVYGKNIAPPTFSRVLNYGEIENLSLTLEGLIHGEHKITYKRPLFIGEEILCHCEVLSHKKSKGSLGTIDILEIGNYGESEDGEFIFSEIMIMIITEKVRKAML